MMLHNVARDLSLLAVTEIMDGNMTPFFFSHKSSTPCSSSEGTE